MLLGINLRVLSLIVIVLTMLSISRLSVLQGLLRIWSGFFWAPL